MVTKLRIKQSRKQKRRVLFTMPALEGCKCLYLVGRFHPGYESVYRMESAEDGTWWLALELDSDCDYQYRYRSDSGVWYDSLAGEEYELPQPSSELVRTQGPKKQYREASHAI